MNYFSIVVGQLIMLIVYAAIGVIAIKTSVLTRDGLRVISRYLTKIALPLLIFTNTINGATREEFFSALPLCIATFFFYIIVYYVTLVLKKGMGMTGNTGNVYHACSTFGNMGFMGIPIIAALFPEYGMLYIALFTIPDQFVLWTLGTNLTLPVDGDVHFSTKDRLLKMVNPNTVGIILAVTGILANVRLPELLNTALVKTGSTATPMAMIYLGGTFCFIDFKNVFKRKEIYASVLVKMTLLPILMYLILSRLAILSQDINVVLSVICALPTMSTIAMMAALQNSDGDYAAGMIFLTTLCSLVTLPLVCLVIGML